MTKTRRTFSAEFKLESAQLVVDQGYNALDVGFTKQLKLVKKLQERYSVNRLCTVFGVHRSTFKYWKNR